MPILGRWSLTFIEQQWVPSEKIEVSTHLHFGTELVVIRATIGHSQSERRKDNRGIVFRVTWLISIGVRHQVVHVTSLDQSACSSLAWGKEQTHTSSDLAKKSFFNEHLEGNLVTSGTCVTSEWRHALDDFKTQSKCKVFASWQKKSWAMDEAMEYNGWTLTLTMVWLNGNGNW